MWGLDFEIRGWIKAILDIDQFIDEDRFVFAFDTDVVELTGNYAIFHKAIGILTDDNMRPVLLVGALKA